MPLPTSLRPPDLILAARQAWARGDAAAADRMCRDALALDPGVRPAWVLLARIEGAAGRQAECRRCAMEAIRGEPGEPQPWAGALRVLCDNRMFREARAALQKAERRFGNSPEGLLALARIAAGGGFVRAAEEWSLRALAAGSPSAGALLEAGRIHRDIGNPGRALRLLERARSCGQGDAGIKAGIEELTSLLGSLGIDPSSEKAAEAGLWESWFKNLLRHAPPPGGLYPPRRGVVAMIVANLGLGGAQRVAADAARALTARREIAGVDVLAWALDSRKNQDFLLEEVRSLSTAGVPVVVREVGEVAAGGIGLPGEPARLLELLPVKLRREIEGFSNALLESRPFVVDLRHGITAAAGATAALLAGVPRIALTFLGQEMIDDPRAPRSFARWALWSAAHRQGSTACAISRETARVYEDWLGVPVAVVAPALPVPGGDRQEDAAKSRAALSIPPVVPIVGGVFRVTPVKRPELWLDVIRELFARAPDLWAVHVGADSPGKDLAAAAQRLGLTGRLRLAGTRPTIHPWLRAMDLFLLTSASEGRAMVLLEAQAVGTPVVATDVGGVSESMVAGTTGFAVPSGDPPGRIAERVLGILADATWRAEAARAGPAFVQEEFGFERLGRALVEVYGMK